MLLQFMQDDPALKDFSHVIIDEIHERSTESDFILALLKLIIPKVCLTKLKLSACITLTLRRFPLISAK